MGIMDIHPITLWHKLTKSDGGEPAARQEVFAKADRDDSGLMNTSMADLLAVPQQYDIRRLFDLYEEMDEFWLSAKVLDDFASEATQVDPGRRKAFWVTSKNKAAEQIGMDVLKQINWEEICGEIAREVAKHGCDFEELIFSATEGKVLSLRWHNPRQIKPIYDEANVLRCYKREEVAQYKYRRHNQKELTAMQNKSTRGNKKDVAPAWSMVQFKLPGRMRDNLYGDSILWPFRRIYKMLARTEDAVANFRWQRSADRLLWKIDVTGVPWAEHYSYLNTWRKYLHKFVAQGKQQSAVQGYQSQGEMASAWKNWHPHEDLYMPVTANKQSGVEQLAAGSDPGQIFDLTYLRESAANSLGAPKYALGFDADPEPGKKLSHKDASASHSVKRIQRALLFGLHRIIQSDMCAKGIDPRDDAMQFEVRGTPLTYLDEQQRQELFDMRVDIVDRMLQMGNQQNLESVSLKEWTKYVLTEFGEMDESFVDLLTAGMKPPPDPMADPTVAAQPAPAQQQESERIIEAVEKHLREAKSSFASASCVSSDDAGVLYGEAELEGLEFKKPEETPNGSLND